MSGCRSCAGVRVSTSAADGEDWDYDEDDSSRMGVVSCYWQISVSLEVRHSRLLTAVVVWASAPKEPSEKKKIPALALFGEKWPRSRPQTLRPNSSSLQTHSISTSPALNVRASDDLVKTAKTVASPGRGILAMDESNWAGKHGGQLLVSAPGLGQYIFGAILFEETLYQSTTDGKKIVDVLISQEILAFKSLSITTHKTFIREIEALVTKYVLNTQGQVLEI
ncbi:hypothetical protein SUGI_0210580 [Cryptomeria japonica]|nr:hypothetical protein SUGI_0210580 [Cryptomeria japonica]